MKGYLQSASECVRTNVLFSCLNASNLRTLYPSRCLYFYSVRLIPSLYRRYYASLPCRPLPVVHCFQPALCKIAGIHDALLRYKESIDAKMQVITQAYVCHCRPYSILAYSVLRTPCHSSPALDIKPEVRTQ